MLIENVSLCYFLSGKSFPSIVFWNLTTALQLSFNFLEKGHGSIELLHPSQNQGDPHGNDKSIIAGYQVCQIHRKTLGIV